MNASTTTAANRRILIVDDNRAIHADFAKIFQDDRRSGPLSAAATDLFGDPAPTSTRIHFELESAFQGQEALDLVQRAVAAGRPYAAAFVDVRMPPGWDGIETIERIWSVQPDLQVILCTAYSDYSWDDMMARFGQCDRLVILKKPFDAVEPLQLAVALTEKWNLEQQAGRRLEDLEAMVEQRTEQLRRSEEHFRLITENAADLVAIVDATGRLSYHSPSYHTVLGYAETELHDVDLATLIHPEEEQRVMEAVQQTIATGAAQVFECRVRHREGHWLTLESHATPFRNAAGAIDGVLIVARDISERRKLEILLRQAQKLESIGHLAAGIAHEINTPTQFIGDNARFLGESFALLRDVLQAHGRLGAAVEAGQVRPELLAAARSAAQAADLDFLMREIPLAIEQSIDGIERVARIVGALRDFAHPGTKEKRPVDLRQAIETSLTVSRNEWKLVADVVTNYDGHLPFVPLVPGEIEQVILNLVINAVHAIADVPGRSEGDRGTITIRTRRVEDRAEISVHDTGGGIPPEIRDKIFDPFFTTKPVGRGSGQGLTISRSVIVEKHGGTLTFETETGRGTTFFIHLPLAVVPPDDGGPAPFTQKILP